MKSRRFNGNVSRASNRKDIIAGNLLQCGILSGLMPLWVNLDRVDRAGTSIHVRYASKSDQIGPSQRTVAKFQKRT